MSLWLLYGARGMIDGSRNTETTTGRMGALFMAFITGCIILYVLWNFKILI
jgi:hypothetical protein